MVFDVLSSKEYAKFVDGSKYGNFMQSYERSLLRNKMGYVTHLIGVKRKGKVVAAGLLVENHHEAWLQNGPILDWEDSQLVAFFLTNLLKYCRAHHVLEVEVYPPVLLSIRNEHGGIEQKFDQTNLFQIFSQIGFKHMGFTEKLDFKALRWMFVKNLGNLQTMRDVELSFNASTRKKYHQTERNLDIYILQDKIELEGWLRPLQESNARNNIKTRSLKYFEDLWDCFGSKATFVEARLKETGETVSSELDIWHPNESVAFLAGTTERLKKYNGITAIKGWQLAECLKRGQKRANFYGIDGIFSGNNNLLNAKSGFHGEIEEYIGGFKCVINPTRYYVSRITDKVRNRIKAWQK